jgi:hypothetical protein
MQDNWAMRQRATAVLVRGKGAVQVCGHCSTCELLCITGNALILDFQGNMWVVLASPRQSYKAVQGSTRQYKAVQGSTRQYKARHLTAAVPW